jgi:DNA repair exonuclease SbcCD ATPase subunit
VLTLKNVSYRNLFSVGHTKIEIDLLETSTTLVSGPNGAGKSTLLDAINYALYGKPYRKITKPTLVNQVNDKQLEVEINISANGREYKIRRGAKPALFEIFEDGVLINQDSKARDYQKYLEQSVLGMSEKAFHQVCLIGASSYVPFMALPAGARREVIEDLLDIKIFSVLSVLLKKKQDAIKEDLKDQDFQIKVTEEKIDLHAQYAKREKATIMKRIEELESKTAQMKVDGNILCAEIQGFTDEEEKFREQIEDEGQVFDGIRKAQDKIRRLEIEDQRLSKEEKFFEDNSSCPTCTQGIPHDHKTKVSAERNAKKEKIRIARDKFKAELTTYEQRQFEIGSIQGEITKLRTRSSVKQNSLLYLTKSREDAESEIKRLKRTNEDKPREEIVSLTGDLSSQKTNRLDLIDTRNYYDISASLLKDGGVKTKIIKQYLPYMNHIINQYLQQFGLPIDFHLDENFNEVIRARFRDELSYNNFSEGEKKRIDLAILLAWRALAKNKNTINCNFLIFDETADTNLDGSTVEELLRIITNLGAKYNVFVVTHKADLMVDKLARHIIFEKQGNFSRIKP